MSIDVIHHFPEGGDSRKIYDAGAGAVGGYLANELSNGDPLLTAAGAGAGVLVSEIAHSSAEKNAKKQYNRGYDRGRSDAVKQQYWIMQNAKKDQGNEQESMTTLIEVNRPAREENGVKYNASTEYIPVQQK